MKKPRRRQSLPRLIQLQSLVQTYLKHHFSALLLQAWDSALEIHLPQQGLAFQIQVVLFSDSKPPQRQACFLGQEIKSLRCLVVLEFSQELQLLGQGFKHQQSNPKQNKSTETTTKKGVGTMTKESQMRLMKRRMLWKNQRSLRIQRFTRSLSISLRYSFLPNQERNKSQETWAEVRSPLRKGL